MAPIVPYRPRTEPRYSPYLGSIYDGAKFAFKHRDAIIKHGKSAGRYVADKVRRPVPVGSKPVKKVQESGSAGVERESGSSSRVVAAKRFKSKGVRQKKPRSVHASKKFKSLVDSALSAKDIFGQFHTVEYGFLKSITANNVQSIGFTLLATPKPHQWDFLPEMFLDAASVLFNGKVAAQNSVGVFSASNIGNSSGAGGLVSTSVANNAKFTVVSSRVEYLLRNNTQHTITVHVYLCAPKVQSNWISPSETTASPAIVIGDALLNPVDFWADCLNDDVALGVNVSSNLTVNTLFCTPTMTRGFARCYKSELTEIVLEPGQTYLYGYQGPSNLDLDFSKMYRNSVFMSLQKFSRFPMFVVRSDLIGTSTGSVVRSSVNNAGFGNLVAMEKRVYYKMKMPDDAGFRSSVVVAGAAAGPVYLGYRRPAYSHQVWTPVPSGANVRVDEEVPVSLELPPQ